MSSSLFPTRCLSNQPSARSRATKVAPAASSAWRRGWLGCVGALALVGCGSDSGSLPFSFSRLLGGETTVFDTSPNAFALAARNMSEERRGTFAVGNSFFNKNWVMAPASTEGRDGLGPTFNARSCSGCHLKDGRGRPPEAADEVMTSMLVRLSIPGTGDRGGPVPEPVYGGQLQPFGIPGVPGEGHIDVDYEEVEGQFDDGTAYTLARPIYTPKDLAFGPLRKDTLTSPRVAPAMIGLGLLEAIPEAAILAAADPDDRDGDGISGRENRVFDPISQTMTVGRFGWKANQPHLRAQDAGAFLGDIGITSSLFDTENCPAPQEACNKAKTGGQPEVSPEILDAIIFYSQTLAVPAARGENDPLAQRGAEVFHETGCPDCHTPSFVTSTSAEVTELRGQTIFPFTDLLLHDLGDELADGRPDFEANGNEWRTPPLWGIGLVHAVNGHTRFLHDGRARNLLEAVLWHGGEAKASRDAVVAASRADREALVAFLESL